MTVCGNSCVYVSVLFWCLFCRVFSGFSPISRHLNGKWMLSNSNCSLLLPAEVPGCVHSALQEQGYIQASYTTITIITIVSSSIRKQPTSKFVQISFVLVAGGSFNITVWVSTCFYLGFLLLSIVSYLYCLFDCWLYNKMHLWDKKDFLYPWDALFSCYFFWNEEWLRQFILILDGSKSLDMCKCFGNPQDLFTDWSFAHLLIFNRLIFMLNGKWNHLS